MAESSPREYEILWEKEKSFPTVFSKEFADNNFEFDRNGREFSKRV